MKDWAYLTTVEEMEQATNSLLENGSKVGADSWQQRVKNQTPHCGFGESGTCCRICSMGPCRITKKAPRGICGCDVHGIVGRNYLRFTAGGSATHSDHGREIMHTLYQTKEGGNYQVKDPEKLIRIAKERGSAVRPDMKMGICGEHGGDPSSIAFCEEVGLTYVSCSPYRVPIARLAAAQAALVTRGGEAREKDR